MKMLQLLAERANNKHQEANDAIRKYEDAKCKARDAFVEDLAKQISRLNKKHYGISLLPIEARAKARVAIFNQDI